METGQVVPHLHDGHPAKVDDLVIVVEVPVDDLDVEVVLKGGVDRDLERKMNI